MIDLILCRGFMEKFTKLTGIVAPLDRPNVDTDAIIPKQYLKSIKRSGFGPNAFDDWRYLDPGAPDIDNAGRRINPDFILNQAPYNKACILLGRENFGCGSSREHAVWALTDFGFRAVIAPSFADIFFNNSFKSGLLPIALSAELACRQHATQFFALHEGQSLIPCHVQLLGSWGNQDTGVALEP